MSVYVSDFDTWSFIHDEFNHSGNIDPGTIVHPILPDESESYDFLNVTCPECGYITSHPIGGGAQPIPIQSLFTVIAFERSCPCGQLTVTKQTQLTEVSNHIKKHCEDMDGVGRWQLDNVVLTRLADTLGAKL